MKGNFWWGVAVGVGGVYAYHKFFKAIPSKKG
jgi:hypothetical protein